MNWLIPFAVAGFIGWKYVWPILKPYDPEHYILLDIPPFKVPAKVGDTIESIRDKYLPTVGLVWELPPKIRITTKWPVSYSRNFDMKSGMTSGAARAAVIGIRSGLYKTSIIKIQSDSLWYWQINIPPVKIPTPKGIQGKI